MKKKNTSIVYFLTRSMFLGFGLSLLFLKSSKDSYIGASIGILIGVLYTFFYAHIIKLKEKQELKDIFKKDRIIGFLSRILLLLASIIILIYVLVIYKIFVVSFLLVNSPELFVTIPFIILTTYCAFKGLTVTSRVASSLLPISLTLFLIIVLSLIGFVETTNFMPILTAKPLSMIETAITFAGISAMPNILTLHIKGDVKGYTRMYIFASITLVVTAFFIEGVLGEALVGVFRFPEYMMLKQIKLFGFIEKVENVLSVVWVFDLLIAAIMAIYSIKELVPEKNNKIITCGILILLIFTIDRFLAFDYVNELIIYYLLPKLSIILPFVVGLPLLYLVKKKN